jgi:2-methylcitrate dehydratase PrpD
MITFAEQFGEFTANLDFKNLSSDHIRNIKLHVLDTLGVCFACSTLPYSQILIDIVREEGKGEESTVISYGDKLPVRAAALVNGSLAHGYNFDDTHIQAIVHPTAIIMPTVLSLGEREKIDGKNAITAIAAGLEIIIRLGLASPTMVQRGIDPNPACGVFGAMAAAGKILGLSPDQIAQAMGICGVMSSGSMEWETDGSWSWCIQAGWAAQAGILAAQMAKNGFSGPPTILEGKQGFYNAFAGAGNYDLKELTQGLGVIWKTADLAFKAYPSCQGTQSYIDCALMIKRDNNIEPDQIEKIECKVGKLIGIRLCKPLEVKVAPPNPDSAQTSIPYTVSAALIEGKVGIPEVSGDKIKDPKILSLARKVKITVDTAYDEGMAIKGFVKVWMKDGRQFVREINAGKGSPENPYSERDVMEKFMSNATMILPETKARTLAEIVFKMDELADMSELMKLCKN